MWQQCKHLGEWSERKEGGTIGLRGIEKGL